MVHRLHNILAALVQKIGFVAFENGKQVALVVVDVEHSHFVKFVVNRNGYDVFQTVFAVERNGVFAALSECVFERRNVAHDDERVNTFVAIGVGYDEFVDAFGIIYKPAHKFAVHRINHTFVERDRVCENGLSVRIAVQVLSLPDRRDFLFPIIETFDTDGRVFRDDFVQPFLGKVRHFGIRIAGLLINEVRSVDRVGGVLFVHRDTRIPSRVVPFAHTDAAFFALASKGKRIVVILKRIGVPVLIRCLPIFLLQGLRGYVHGRCRKIARPYIARGVGAYDVICARIDGVNDCAVLIRYAVDRNLFDGCEYVRIAVCPSNRNVSVRLAVRNVVERQRLVRAVDNDRIFTGRQSCGILGIEYILAGNIIFGAGCVCGKSIRTGLLNINAFQIRIRCFKLDMPRVRIAAV